MLSVCDHHCDTISVTSTVIGITSPTPCSKSLNALLTTTAPFRCGAGVATLCFELIIHSFPLNGATSEKPPTRYSRKVHLSKGACLTKIYISFQTAWEMKNAVGQSVRVTRKEECKSNSCFADAIQCFNTKTSFFFIFVLDSQHRLLIKHSFCPHCVGSTWKVTLWIVPLMAR